MVTITWAAIVCALGFLAWLGSKAWESGEAFALLPTYLIEHGGRVVLGLIVTAALFIMNVKFRETALTAADLVTIFFMAFGAISFVSHGPGGKK